ncbi:MAG: DsrH/TusB family sulfur metabolism protein [Thermodesulfovibrionales bacterium]|nr:DsrH/TusB family sulfur metabolism protein [Thermodesulfovibrionales bacterium]
MLVIVKSGPDTAEGKRGVKLARDMAADLFLIQNGVYFAQKERLEGFCGTAHVLEDDLKLRGVKGADIEKSIRETGYDSFVDLMADNDKVIGMF